jgi:hypothetical protein
MYSSSDRAESPSTKPAPTRDSSSSNFSSGSTKLSAAIDGRRSHAVILCPTPSRYTRYPSLPNTKTRKPASPCTRKNRRRSTGTLIIRSGLLHLQARFLGLPLTIDVIKEPAILSVLSRPGVHTAAARNGRGHPVGDDAAPPSSCRHTPNLNRGGLSGQARGMKPWSAHTRQDAGHPRHLECGVCLISTKLPERYFIHTWPRTSHFPTTRAPTWKMDDVMKPHRPREDLWPKV